jgi:hypothetical protein
MSATNASLEALTEISVNRLNLDVPSMSPLSGLVPCPGQVPRPEADAAKS